MTEKPLEKICCREKEKRKIRNTTKTERSSDVVGRTFNKRKLAGKFKLQLSTKK